MLWNARLEKRLCKNQAGLKLLKSDMRETRANAITGCLKLSRSCGSRRVQSSFPTLFQPRLTMALQGLKVKSEVKDEDDDDADRKPQLPSGGVKSVRDSTCHVPWPDSNLRVEGRLRGYSRRPDYSGSDTHIHPKS